MSKGLKSLKEIFGAIEAVDGNANCHFDMEEIADMFGNVEKELKALEIIKNKKVDVKDIYKYDNYLQYNYNYLGLLWEYRLTQEEYMLLKEVLTND